MVADRLLGEDGCADGVTECFERLFYAKEASVKARYLLSYLRTGDRNRLWVVSILLEGPRPILLRKQRLKVMLRERVQEWELKVSQDFMGDPCECMARLWPQRWVVESRSLDWANVHVQLTAAERDDREPLAAKMLDGMDEAQRWLMLLLYAKQFSWGLSRQTVFETLAACGDCGVSVEAYWYHLSAEPAAFERLLEGHFDPGELIPGSAFQKMPAWVDLRLVDVMEQLDAVDYEVVKIPQGGYLVQWVVTEVERSLYDPQGNRLDRGFADLLTVVADPMVAIGFVTDHGQGGGVEKRLAVLNKGRGVKATDELPVKFQLLELLEGRAPEQHQWFGKLERSPLISWESVRGLEDVMLVRKQGSAEHEWHWVNLLPDPQVLEVVLLYAFRDPGVKRLGALTVGLKNSADAWVPLCNLRADEVGILDVDRFSDWVKTHLKGKKGPIIEFEKTLVFEIEYTSCKEAPRRKCGVELQHVKMKRIAWEQRTEELKGLMEFKETLGMGG